MKRELKIKCEKCNSLMEFDYYSNKFICHQCGNKYSKDEINTKEKIIEFDFDKKNINVLKLPIKYQKEDLKKEIKNKTKRKLLLPSIFLKLKEDIDIKTKEYPLIVYNAKVLIKSETKDIIYELNNKIFDDYIDFDSKDLLYPIDLDIEKENITVPYQNLSFNRELEDIVQDIEIEIKKLLDANLVIDNIKNYDILFLEENYQIILVSLYELEILYNNKNYRFLMNANIGNISMNIPMNTLKFLLIPVVLFIIDIFFFLLLHKLEMAKNLTLTITIFVFITELLMICLIYASSKVNINNTLGFKNKVQIKHKDIK